MPHIFSLIRMSPRLFPAVVILGILAALSESIGLSFFIPLLETAKGAESSIQFWIPAVNRVLNELADQQRQIVTLSLIFVAMMAVVG